MPKQPEARKTDQPLALSSSAVLGHTPRHPTLAECEAAGRGPKNYPGKPFEVGGLPATKEERARFEAYMRGHCWDVGHYVDAEECYDTTFVRCLFGVWRDRGALPTVWPNARLTGPQRDDRETTEGHNHA